MDNATPLKAKEGANTVFLSDSRQVYRIPALCYDKASKTLTAFAERRTSADDSHSVALVMRRGDVDFNSNPPRVTWSEPKDVVRKEALNGYRPMNPCPVYERTSKTLFLFFIGVEGTVSEPSQICSGSNRTRLFYIRIKDAGKTLGEVKNVTDSLPEIKNWSTFAVGPGHGCQTESGGLLVPAYAYPLCRCSRSHSSLSRALCCCSSWCCINCCCPSPAAFSIYTDNKDHDNIKLKVGQMFGVKSLECQMAEFSDGKDMLVYCNARSGGGLRVEAVSDSGGKRFRKLTSKLVETGVGCQGSVVSFPAQAEGSGSGQEPQWLLYSHPTSKSQRVRLGVYLNKSPQHPDAWSQPWILNQGPSGYSDLAHLGDGWFACLMERGEKSELEQIACKLFSYKDVEEGIKKDNQQ